MIRKINQNTYFVQLPLEEEDIKFLEERKLKKNEIEGLIKIGYTTRSEFNKNGEFIWIIVPTTEKNVKPAQVVVAHYKKKKIDLIISNSKMEIFEQVPFKTRGDAIIWILKETAITLLKENEQIARKLQQIEEKLSTQTLNKKEVEEVFSLKRKTLYMLRIALEDLELINELIEVYRKVKKNAHITELRVVKEQFIELQEITKMNKEIINEILNMNSTKLDLLINESVKKLTVFASVIGIPFLITGIYGMNFRYMPEIYWRYGYYFALILIVITAFISYIIIKRKG